MKKTLLLCTLLTAALLCSCGQVDGSSENDPASQVSDKTQTTLKETTASTAEETSAETAETEETAETVTTTVAETTSSETTVSETTPAETTVQEDDNKDGIIIADGVWLSTYMTQSGVQSQAYYELRSDGTGVKINLHNGQSEYFEYRTEGMNIIIEFQYTGTLTAEV